MTLLYFAWVREQIGPRCRGDRASLGRADGGSAARLAAEPRGGYASALNDLSVIRVAVNQEFAAPDHAVADGDEIALFPPVTGGAPS